MPNALAREATNFLPGETVLRARGLTKSFRGYVAVNGINLAVRAGEIHALIGPNGAGKTTVFNLISKFLTPTAGEIFYRGENVTGASAADIARMGLVRSFQVSATFQQLNVRENVRLALQRPRVSARRFWQSSKSLSDLDGRVAEILTQMDLAALADTRADELPYGHKRALELATTLAADPAVMLLDEPTQGLGIEEVDRITGLIKRFAGRRTVFMVEHNMKMVSAIADRISVLRYGEIIAEGSYAEVSAHPEVIEAYLGSRARRGATK